MHDDNQKERINIGSGAPWESIVGYSRLVRIGSHIWVAGTTATDEHGKVVGIADPGTQTRQTLINIGRALEKAGARLEHVVRTRVFVTNIDDWEVIGRVHGEVFGDVRPASTMVEISRLVSPDMLVEIEAEAFLP